MVEMILVPYECLDTGFSNITSEDLFKLLLTREFTWSKLLDFFLSYIYRLTEAFWGTMGNGFHKMVLSFEKQNSMGPRERSWTNWTNNNCPFLSLHFWSNKSHIKNKESLKFLFIKNKANRRRWNEKINKGFTSTNLYNKRQVNCKPYWERKRVI